MAKSWEKLPCTLEMLTPAFSKTRPRSVDISPPPPPGDAPPPPPDPLRLAIPVPDEFPLLRTEAGSSIQISADGSTIAYLGVNGGESSLFIRGRSDIAPREVANTAGTRMFFLSPTGDEVAFVGGNDQKLRSASTTLSRLSFFFLRCWDVSCAIS